MEEEEHVGEDIDLVDSDGEVNQNNDSEAVVSSNTEEAGAKDISFPFLPPTFFQWKYDGKGKDGKFKLRKVKCLIDGCSKHISVSATSRGNVKRHVKLCHQEKLNEYIRLITDQPGKNKKEKSIIAVKERVQMKQQKLKFRVSKITTQREFDNSIIKYIVDDILPLHTTEKRGFWSFMQKLAPEFTIKSRFFYKNLLTMQYQARKEELIAALQNATWVCTTTDCWCSYRKSFIGKTVHWYDNKLQRHKACLAVRRLVGKVDYIILAHKLDDIYTEFKIAKKIEATVTDGGSNFMKAFRLYSTPTQTQVISDDEESKDDEDPDMILPTQDITGGTCFDIGDSSKEYHPIPVWNIFEQAVSCNTDGTDEEVSLDAMESSYSLPIHRQCAAHLLNLMATADLEKKIVNKTYKRLLHSTDGKVQAACNKQGYSAKNSDVIRSHIGRLFVTKNKTRWNSYFDCMKCFSKLLRKNNEAMENLFKALGLSWFRSNEQEFIHEYVKVMEPVADALDVLQGEISISMSYLLPTLTILREKLNNHQRDTTMKHANPLVCSLLDSLKDRFDHMFNIPQIRLAAICDPSFKVKWLPEEEQDSYKKLLKKEYEKWEKETIEEEKENSEPEDECSGDSGSTTSPRKKNFFSSLWKKPSKVQPQNEVDLFFAEPLGHVEQLSKYPILTKIFRKYNAVLPSSASVERLFSKAGLVFTSKRTRLADGTLDMLVFLNVNSKETCSW